MLLQPLVENAIKHGLSPKIGGGSIYIRSRLEAALLVIEVEDDGVGVSGNQANPPLSTGGHGIGMANVKERLKVLFGPSAFMRVESGTGRGTIVRLHVPVLQSIEQRPRDMHPSNAATRKAMAE